MLLPGLVSITFRDLSTADIIRHVADNGLAAIEWGGDVHVPHGKIATAKETRAKTEDAGLAVAAYGSYYKFQELFGESGPDWRSVLDTAEALGAPTLRVWAGMQGSAETSPDMRAAVVDRSREIARAAGERGMELAFEYHRNSLTDTNESARRLLDEIDHPNANTLWQPPNGASPAYCVEGLHAVGGKLSNVHCFHWGPAGSSDKRPLEEGADRWQEYLRIVQTLTPAAVKRYVLLEFVAGGSVEAFRRDAGVLKSWLSSIRNAHSQ